MYGVPFDDDMALYGMAGLCSAGVSMPSPAHISSFLCGVSTPFGLPIGGTIEADRHEAWAGASVWV